MIRILPGRRRVSILGLALLLGLGSAARGPAARAASVDQGTQSQTQFYMNFHPPTTICVGENSPVKVTLLARWSGTTSTGEPIQADDIVVPGITLEASTQDASIADVTPGQASSGILPDPTDLLQSGRLGASPGLGEVTFAIRGKKPGMTAVSLKAHLPRSLGGSPGNPVQARVTLVVAQCRFMVEFTSHSSFRLPNLDSEFTAIASGEMSLVDASDPSGRLSGTAVVDYTMVSSTVGCSHRHVITAAPAHLDGALRLDNTLDVTLTFDPFTMATQDCAASNQGTFTFPPATQNNLPVRGVTRSRALSWVLGAESMRGIATLTVLPVPGR